MDQIIRIGMDTSKHIFQLHGVNAAEEPVLRKKLRRHDLEAFFTKLPPTVIGIEACGGSHHWARLLQSLGLNHPRYNPMRRVFATVITAIVLIGNLSFPVAVLTGLLREAPRYPPAHSARAPSNRGQAN